jgi:hypothetical protein
LSWKAKPNLLSGSYLSVGRIPFRNQPPQVILNGGLVNSIPVAEPENPDLSITQSRFANAILALALIGVPVFGSSGIAFAEGTDPSPAPTASGRPHGEHRQANPAPAMPPVKVPGGQVSNQDEQDENSQKQSQIAKKYGDEREVATPPLIVKPASPVAGASTSTTTISNTVRPSSNKVSGASVSKHRKPATKYVSQPLNVALHQLQKPGTSQSAAKSQIKAFNAAKNAPVIQNIHRDEMSSPAQEFFSKAYFGMALMVIFGALLVGYWLRKQKSARGSDQNDG